MEIIIKVGHPSNNMVADVEIEEKMTINDMIEELIEEHFLEQYEWGYSAVWKGKEYSDVWEGKAAPRLLDENKTLQENGVGDGAFIRIVKHTLA